MLGDESRPSETTGFSKHHPHHTETRHSYMVSKWQETGDGGADGPPGDKVRGSLRMSSLLLDPLFALERTWEVLDIYWMGKNLQD